MSVWQTDGTNDSVHTCKPARRDCQHAGVPPPPSPPPLRAGERSVRVLLRPIFMERSQDVGHVKNSTGPPQFEDFFKKSFAYKNSKVQFYN